MGATWAKHRRTPTEPRLRRSLAPGPAVGLLEVGVGRMGGREVVDLVLDPAEGAGWHAPA